MMEMLGGIVIGLVGGVAASFLGPVRQVSERLGRRILDPAPIDINIETDLGIIWAADPDWIGASFWVPDAGALSAPPSSLALWQQWVRGLGGHDRGTATIRLTLVARAGVTVVIGMPQVEASREPLPEGHNLVRPVGGAEIRPLGIDVQLDGGWVSLTDHDGPVQREALSWYLTPGEVKQFLIRVSAGTEGLWRWRLKLPVIVDGERRLRDITDKGDDFVVVGMEAGADEEMWTEDHWWSRRTRDPSC